MAIVRAGVSKAFVTDAFRAYATEGTDLYMWRSARQMARPDCLLVESRLRSPTLTRVMACGSQVGFRVGGSKFMQPGIGLAGSLVSLQPLRCSSACAGIPLPTAKPYRAAQASDIESQVGATSLMMSKQVMDSNGSKVAEPWHVFSPTALAVLNTVGNLFALAAAASHDHVMLRLLAGTASMSVAAFNVLMPKPLKAHQKTAAAWGIAFATLHFVNLGILLFESQGIVLSEEEEDIYEHGFQKHGVTPRQFRKLLNAGGKFVDFAPGQLIAKANAPVDRVIYVVHGSCVSERLEGLPVLEYHQDVFIGELQPSTWRAQYLGCPILMSDAEDPQVDDLEEEWLIEHADAIAKRKRGRRSNLRKVLQDGLQQKVGSLTQLKVGSAWMGTTRAGSEGCRAIVWPLGAFTCAVGADDKLCKSVENIDEMGLASKLSAGSSRKSLDGYRELLTLVVEDAQIHPLERHALQRYRARHAVPDEEHLRMLKELGWSEAEYNDGILIRKRKSSFANFFRQKRG
eukprot:TRINITY_DN37153_c0_g1_i1.p1 TRINITY_DN37153_c0_g1~~TRINITY_DN37153_c0_g1_i1.p1  ORF type:complete len:514 (+),score=72.95 TRINITY_DN37153_c0_g1_i1:53-1594(+)